MALIQGPPGTGKTYVGIQLVKALVANTHGNDKIGSDRKPSDADTLFPDMPCNLSGPCIGPILIVCYTNHALDQFLEELLAAGLTDLVRVGGR